MDALLQFPIITDRAISIAGKSECMALLTRGNLAKNAFSIVWQSVMIQDPDAEPKLIIRS